MKNLLKKTERGYQNMAVEGRVDKVENPNDYYQTPAIIPRMAYRILEAVANIPPQTELQCLDIGAGKGVWGKELATYSGVSRLFPAINYIDGIEINKEFAKPADYRLWEHEDFRIFFDFPRIYHLVVGNPPFGKTQGIVDRKLAEKAIRFGWDSLQRGGWMCYLLKSVFAEGEERGSDFFRSHRPTRIMMSSARIPFRPEINGDDTNTVSYSLFYWHKDENAEPAKRTDFGWFDWKQESINL